MEASSELSREPRVGHEGGRPPRYDKDYTQGNIVGNLMTLGWPMMVGGSLNMLGPTIDMIWVGKLGESAIAGVGISGMVVMLANSAMMGLYQGLRAMIARAIGAGNPEEANHVTQQALIISFAYSIAMAIIGLFLARPILVLLGVGPDVVDEGVPYLRINFVGMITLSMRMIGEAAMQASGDSKKPMYVAIFFRAFHVALSPLLIFGIWIFPRMGVTGAAVTNIFSQGIGAAIGLWYLFGGRTRLKLSLKGFRFDGPIIWRLARIGFPASITGMGRTFGNLIIMWFMTPFGTVAVAAHSLNQRIEMFINTPQMSFGQAAGVLAGQNLGAKQPGRAEKTGWIASGLLSILMLVISAAIFIWAPQVIRIFNTDPALVDLAGTFLRIACAGWLVLGLTSVFQQCLNGVGDTVVPMVVMMVNFWLLQVVLAFFLTRHTSFGVYGVRWAIVIGTATAAIVYTVYFKMGRWKRAKV